MKQWKMGHFHTTKAVIHHTNPFKSFCPNQELENYSWRMCEAECMYQRVTCTLANRIHRKETKSQVARRQPCRSGSNSHVCQICGHRHFSSQQVPDCMLCVHL
jgi:hypothetical protein